MSTTSTARPRRFPWSRGEAPKLSTQNEGFYRASQRQLVWWKFRRHKLAQLAMIVLSVFYIISAFAEFIAPHEPLHRYDQYAAMPPTAIQFYDPATGIQLPFIYPTIRARDPVTARPRYQVDTSKRYPIQLFTRGDSYKLWGLIESDIHLFGTAEVTGSAMPLFIFGTDKLGRDVLSRIFYGARISLTVGLVGVFLAFILGLVLGGIAGYFGGLADELVMRLIDLLIAIPTIPLWMSLAAALPQNWPQLQVYFGITIILSILGWTNLGRVVRGKILSLREEDFTLAARLDGEREGAIIARYLLPAFASYIIVNLTLAIPHMILGETSLSFLGIGLKSPTISWGVMLQDAQDIMSVFATPWVLWPVAFVVLAVLMFNFLGDGLRDAADPYVT